MGTRPQRETPTARHDLLHGAFALCLGLVVMSCCGYARAESTRIDATGTSAAASADLDFKIVIPKVLRLNASTGMLFTNARRSETVVVSTSEAGIHRTVVSRSDPGSIVAAMNTVTRDAGRSQAGYTVTMP